MRYSRVRVLAAAVVAVASIAVVAQQRGPTAAGAANGEWRTYGADLRSTRYAPLDQINKDNFSKLEVAWRFKTFCTAQGGRVAPLWLWTPRPVKCCGCTA